MPLTDLIARIAPNLTTPNTSKLQAQLAEAEAALASKQAALDSLLIAGEIDGPATAKAADAADAAERRVKHLRGALAAAQTKQAAQRGEAEQDAKRAAWQNAVKLAEERHAAIETLAKSMVAFAADYRAVLKINSELLAHLPTNQDSMATLTDRFALETALRKQLVKLGLPFCFSWPYGAATLPELMPQFDGALSVIRRAVPQDLR